MLLYTEVFARWQRSKCPDRAIPRASDLAFFMEGWTIPLKFGEKHVDVLIYILHLMFGGFLWWFSQISWWFSGDLMRCLPSVNIQKKSKDCGHSPASFCFIGEATINMTIAMFHSSGELPEGTCFFLVYHKFFRMITMITISSKFGTMKNTKNCCFWYQNNNFWNSMISYQ